MNHLFTKKIILSFFTLFIFLFFSCEKEPKVVIKTVTETITVVDTLTIIDTITIVETIVETLSDTATTFIIIRHCETVEDGTNPSLSAEGEARLVELSRILQNVPLSGVFSTNYNRTKETAQPIADDKNLTLSIYPAFDLDPFVDSTISNHKGGVVLVVGHSNTSASLLNTLIGSDVYPDFPEEDYDFLFVVTVFEKGRANVLHMKYGE